MRFSNGNLKIVATSALGHALLIRLLFLIIFFFFYIQTFELLPASWISLTEAPQRRL